MWSSWSIIKSSLRPPSRATVPASTTLLRNLIYSTSHTRLQSHPPKPTTTPQAPPIATAKMPTYIVTCDENATADQVAAAKKHAVEQGGEIVHDLDIIKGFSVKFPDDAVTTLKASEHVKAVELDGEVRIQ
ncbi:hypothetical protein MAPG_01092 [Magnaporthiopsis poae ATCC 64411]|uniref:Inhibitor I9 domain-containing protein n=1 Tax=Magnaporthiopsis poae (strain ATCC 64411 / 73-15) TaxID=644358 RepID=A0A0C4DMT0_MAGP6|nr:hypothetical protein MAPG_01092 [Magnaporthiopsis poae ATCC 64411]